MLLGPAAGTDESRLLTAAAAAVFIWRRCCCCGWWCCSCCVAVVVVRCWPTDPCCWCSDLCLLVVGTAAHVAAIVPAEEAVMSLLHTEPPLLPAIWPADEAALLTQWWWWWRWFRDSNMISHDNRSLQHLQLTSRLDKSIRYGQLGNRDIEENE